MRKFIAAIILIPLAILMVMFAVANRGSVAISLDPFSANAPALTVHMPLFLLLLIALIVGVLAGGIAAWLRQAKWRRAARRLDRELLDHTVQGLSRVNRTILGIGQRANVRMLCMRAPPFLDPLGLGLAVRERLGQRDKFFDGFPEMAEVLVYIAG